MKKLNITEINKPIGYVKILNLQGKMLAENHNLVVNTGLNLQGNMLLGKAGFTGLEYCAVGTNATAPAASDVKLGTETARVQLTSSDMVNNVATILCFFLIAESSVYIKEVGLFGNGATSAADSGTLYAHSAVDYDNSGTPQDLVISWSITF